MKPFINYLILSLFWIIPLFAQSLELPRLSTKAEVTQQIGLSKVAINYSRPGVKGRKIWGGLVPYNNGIPFPWRAGANENTTIEISDDAEINGKFIKAGVYGFHIIPSETEWILIFNNHNKSWGSFFYDETFDALRVKVIPSQNEFTEWLEYGFEDITSSSVTVYMKWEKLKINFKISFDENEIVLKNIREQLLSLPGFGWEGPMEAAAFCLNNNFNYDEALEWIDVSINRNPTFQNKIIKAELLLKIGEIEKSDKVRKEAFENSSEKELNDYGYELLNKNNIDEALEIFKMNISRHPNSWNCYDSYGDALTRAGKNDEAIKNYKKALELAPENKKERIRKTIK
ncbi:MAG: DUF2911 domain-containing protein [Melioribacteraceae bacterium]|nr:DUF2911 domain-containing protein [Melioribacteraceae bacterium]